MSKGNNSIESPATYGVPKPGDAGSLPTKHYPSSGKLGKGDKPNAHVIEGPCTEEGSHRGYK